MSSRRTANWKKRAEGPLRDVRPNIARNAPVKMDNFGPALRLRMAIGASRSCPERACRRSDICVKPILDCVHRPLADAYDWDYGWGLCSRKEFYGVMPDSWQHVTDDDADEEADDDEL
jgi:hypothetical protein